MPSLMRVMGSVFPPVTVAHPDGGSDEGVPDDSVVSAQLLSDGGQ
jgi:hypothetical protein